MSANKNSLNAYFSHSEYNKSPLSAKTENRKTKPSDQPHDGINDIQVHCVHRKSLHIQHSFQNNSRRMIDKHRNNRYHLQRASVIRFLFHCFRHILHALTLCYPPIPPFVSVSYCTMIPVFLQYYYFFGVLHEFIPASKQRCYCMK